MKGIILCLCLLIPTLAKANCVTIDLASWQEGNKEFLLHVASAIAGDAITMTPKIPVPIEIGIPLERDTTIELCAPIADISELDSATLAQAAQIIVDEQALLTIDRQSDVAEARTELRTNTFCNASPALLGTRIDAEKATVQASIDAIADPQTRTAMTLLNNRTWAAMKFMVKCGKSRATIGGE